MRYVSFLTFAAIAYAAPLTFRPDGNFKILHVSDVHFQIGPATACQGLNLKDKNPCSGHNSTSFVQRLIKEEQPDLVVHTGDIVDWATHPSHVGMDELYGASMSAHLPWAATLGNHDGQSDLSRHQVVQYIVGMNETLTQMGCVANSDGNYFLDIFANSSDKIPAFRTWHLDVNANNHYSADQVAWYNTTSISKQKEEGVQTPSVMFFHIPIEEYNTSLQVPGAKISGHQNEVVSFLKGDGGLFAALKDRGEVKATFCGHDHTNDYCVLYEGIQLCYEGSPGYQAYAGINGDWSRRARVTELRNFGKEVWSWKRLDDVVPVGTVVDKEMLWSASGPVELAHRTRSPPPQHALPKLSQFALDQKAEIAIV